MWAPTIVGVLLLAAFVVAALRRPERALLDVRLLRRRGPASSTAVLFLSGASLYGSMLLLPLYFQSVRGADALAAGLILIPQGVGTLLSRTLAGKLTDSVGARWVALVGFVVTGAATVPFALAGPSTNEWWLMAVLLVRGIGLGAITIPVMSVAFVGLERAEVPHASIITRLAQQIGGAFGTAILAVILQTSVVGAATPSALAAAFDSAFWWAIGFSLVAMIVALFLPGRPAAVPEPALSGDRVSTAAARP